MEQETIQTKKDKLKKEIIEYYTMLKQGCSLPFCFNTYCRKSTSFLFHKLDAKELLAEAMRLANESTPRKCLVFSESNGYNIFNLVSLFTSEDGQLIYDKLINSYLITKIDFSSLLSILIEHKTLLKVNNSLCLPVFSKLLIFVVLHPQFGFSSDTNMKLKLFFDFYKSLAKSSFSSLPLNELPRTAVEQIVNNFNNFLSVYLFETLNSEFQDQSNFCSVPIIQSFLDVFEILFNSNKVHRIVSYSLFYNTALNENFNLKADYKIFFGNLKRKENKFCFLKYHFIFSAAQKFEILNYFNNGLQKEEVLKSLNVEDLLTATKESVSLMLKISRDNIVEETMNFVHYSEVNLRKPLRVKFIGEDGVDEGGVKKEFFLLFVRQVFDPNYSMFTYHEELRFFWFNPFTFESTLKFELIGVIFGLALFNGVILDVNFPLGVFKKMLGEPCTIDVLM